MHLGLVQKAIDAGKLDAKGTLTQAELAAAGLVRGGKDGVRILGKGAISAKVSLRVAGVSAGARQAIEGAGGSVEVIEVTSAADKHKAKHRKGQRSQAKTA